MSAPSLASVVAPAADGADHARDVRDAAAATSARDVSRAWLRPARDAAIGGFVLASAIFLGSGGFAQLDPALVGYLGATFLAFVATVYRASAFWRRPASAFYARALGRAALRPASLRSTIAHAGRDLAAQDFVRKRGILRWLAHLLLSLGTLASFAITVPLVFGWMSFVVDGAAHYRIVVFTVPTVRFAVDGVLAWLLFHGLSLAGFAVLLGAAYFLVHRFRVRALPGATAGFAVAPLVLLLVVAATGLALPATREMPSLFPIAALLHEIAVVVLLVAIPFSKLGHVLIRPLQLGARAVHAETEPRLRCACGAVLAPAKQAAAVADLLERRGLHLAAQVRSCPACRRRGLATAQAGIVDAYFQPRLAGARPATTRSGRSA